VIVDEIDVAHVAVLESEDDTPVGPHRDGPEAPQITGQRMKPEARQRHVLNRRGRVEQAENVLDPLDELGIDALPLAIPNSRFRPLWRKLSINFEPESSTY
jgi:hypothetical protein